MPTRKEATPASASTATRATTVKRMSTTVLQGKKNTTTTITTTTLVTVLNVGPSQVDPFKVPLNSLQKANSMAMDYGFNHWDCGF